MGGKFLNFFFFYYSEFGRYINNGGRVWRYVVDLIVLLLEICRRREFLRCIKVFVKGFDTGLFVY